MNVPDVRFSVESKLKAGHILICGFPKAEQIQFNPPLFHRHTTNSEGGRTRVFPLMWKKSREEWREESGEVTLATEVALWYSPNPTIHSIHPESLRFSHFNGHIGASQTRGVRCLAWTSAEC